jgi:superfamily II helicase
MNPTTKHCRKCLHTKPVELFSKGRNTKDGYQSICKSCWKLIANNLPIKQNPDVGYGEFDDKIIQVNDEAIVIGKLTPEEKDKLRRKWKMSPYNEVQLTTEQMNELWNTYASDISEKHKGQNTGKRGTYNRYKRGYNQRQVEQEQYINALENDNKI